jgi:hypothetical protein
MLDEFEYLLLSADRGMTRRLHGGRRKPAGLSRPRQARLKADTVYIWMGE